MKPNRSLRSLHRSIRKALGMGPSAHFAQNTGVGTQKAGTTQTSAPRSNDRLKEQFRQIKTLESRIKTSETRIKGLEQRVKEKETIVKELERQLRASSREVAETRSNLAGVALLYDFASGGSIGEKLVGVVRYFIETGKSLKARSLAYIIYSDQKFESIGKICFFLSLYYDGLRDACGELAESGDKELFRRLALAEWLDILADREPDFATRVLAELAGTPPVEQPPKIWLSLAILAYRLSAHDLAANLAAKVTATTSAPSDEAAALAERAGWLIRSLERIRNLGLHSTRENAEEIRIGILDYGSPDFQRTSSNIGDYVQTVAMLGHLARWRFERPVSCIDEQALRYFQMIQDRIATPAHLDPVARPLRLVPVDRDFSSVADPSGPIWLIAFGWHMHPHFGAVYDFPYPAHIRPIFISFHINKVEMLTAEAEAYLKRYAPIGCRDWTTVYILRERGIPAYFSGCMTLTTNQVFGDLPAERGDGFKVADIDLRPADRSDTATTYTQEYPEVRHRTLGENLFDAHMRLEDYRSFDRIRAMRLHAYLPCASMGLDVEFIPRNKADVRFEGLAELEHDASARDRLSAGIKRKLEIVLRQILNGADEKVVYRALAEACETDIRAADEYVLAPIAPPAWVFDLGRTLGQLQAARYTLGRVGLVPDVTEVHLAFAFDDAMFPYVQTTMRSVVANTNRRIVVHLLTRGVERNRIEGIAAAFPEVKFDVIPMDEIDYGADAFLLKHISISTMDRLLLPSLLDEVGRLVYLDLDVVVLGDVGELFDHDLGTSRIAARSSIHPAWFNGYHIVYRAALRLDHGRAYEFRRLMHRTHDLRFRCFNAGVLVMDLAGMRADRFCQAYLPFVWHYRCHDQDVLNCYAGPDRAELPADWNFFPSQELPPDTIKLIHWVGPVKQWSEDYTLYRERWSAYSNPVPAETV